jgi:hypothetical protein
MKTRHVKRKPGTHFEQIPVKVVKKIVGGSGSKKTSGTDNLIIERVPIKTEPYSMLELWLEKAGR